MKQIGGMKIWVFHLLNISLSWSAPLIDRDTELELQDKGVHNHTDPYRSGNLFHYNQFGFGDIKLQGQVVGDQTVTIGHNVNVEIEESLSESNDSPGPDGEASAPDILTDSSLGDHKYFVSDTVNLHYVESGDRENPLIVFLHGFPDFWLSWYHQIKHFQQNYHVVALDMRGYGNSDKPAGVDKYNIDLLVNDVKNLVNHLQRDSFTLVGHGWGGMVAWYFAARYPGFLKSLVILTTPHPLAFHRLFFAESDNEQKKKSGYIAIVLQPQPTPELFLMKDNLAFFNDRIKDGKMRAAYKYVFRKITTWNRAINYYRDYFANIAKAEKDYGAGLKKIDPPTILIFGTGDKYYSVNAAHSSSNYVTNFTLELLEGGSHDVHKEEPKSVNNLIANFMMKI